MSPPLILHVAQPMDAGVPAVVGSLVADQLSRGWEVAVASPMGGNLAEAVPQTAARWHSWTASRSPGPRTLLEARALSLILSREKPHLVHLHSAKAGLAGRLVLQGRLPTVFQPHAWAFEVESRPVAAAALAWERLAVRWTDAVVCVSDDERRRGEAAHIRGRWEVIPNGVDLNRFRPANNAARTAARRDLDIEQDAPLAVVVGRLSRQKGQDVLVRAWPLVLQELPLAHLLLVGDGPEGPRLADMAGPNVRLIGAVVDVRPWLVAADVVVAPSRYEAGLSLAVMEAMATARSVVATEVAGTRDGLVSEAGALVGVDHVEALVRQIVIRLRNRALADAEGAAGRRRVEQNFDAKQAAPRMAAVYERVLATKVGEGRRGHRFVG